MTWQAGRFGRRSACALALLVLLQACATGPQANPRDPWEPFNRRVDGFNQGLDEAVLKPVATAYEHVVPQLLRSGVSNFFDNLSDVWSLANNALQLKPQESVETFFRLGVNTFMGLGGVLDVASEMGLPKHREDFGQTLGYWGVPDGPYVVLPLLGPSTLRDSLALPVDTSGDVVSGLSDVASRNALYSLRVMDTRASLLRASDLLEGAALDKYSFTRDAYLQRRRGQVTEGRDKPDEQVEERYDLDEVMPQTAVSGASRHPSLPDGNRTSPSSPSH